MNHRKNDKHIKRRIKQCGRAVESLHEISLGTSGSVSLQEVLDEMYLTLMASESYLAQDNTKRRETTFLYQIMRESIHGLAAVPW